MKESPSYRPVKLPGDKLFMLGLEQADRAALSVRGKTAGGLPTATAGERDGAKGPGSLSHCPAQSQQAPRCEPVLFLYGFGLLGLCFCLGIKLVFQSVSRKTEHIR